MNQQKQIHIPVLEQEVLHYLKPQKGEHYLDLTSGYGGHAARVLEEIGLNGKATLVDRDLNAVEHLTKKFGNDARVEIIHDDYLTASRNLKEGAARFDLILADIGLSSPHIDNASRGFSFQQDGPLDMRMDPRQQITAGTIVNTYGREELVSILREYGEVRQAAKIADAIIAARPLKSTQELAGTIKKCTGNNPKLRNEAKVFQALRIVVNDELKQLENSLPMWHEMLKPGGRLAVISFHSLEDRLVKQYFQSNGGDRYDADLLILTKQPVTCTNQESLSNPRARSAKLRVAQRK